MRAGITRRHYFVACDVGQTLSFNDGVSSFQQKGTGKVVVLGELEARLRFSPDRIVYGGESSRPVVRGEFDLPMRVAAPRSHNLTDAIESLPSGLHRPRNIVQDTGSITTFFSDAA